MTHSRGIQTLSEQIGVEPDHVAHALRLASRTFAAIQTTHFRDMTADQFRRLIGSDRHAVAIVANLAMRHAKRIEDAQILMSVYKASSGIAPHRPVIRKGVGTLPEYRDHAYVRQAIHILQAADLPPIHTDGTHELRPGFQVMPGCDDLPGWLFIAPDPDAEARTGFAGGRLGYLAVMRWAGWGVITEPLTDDHLWAVCHPDYRNNPFPS
ncbi:hypothetical protein Q5762_14675 [Streptomyces sp. P9(2023)]|uniref:hypothetical protein n=1 Tax=Streptomyces sp. P9(2023) TaxID=3064394 RepID=UPI0028F448F0|nr:hypothetical protein [Streptomyces sp. P9(2023)]MDT9689560.1 hypothetical protein [Streptomyces sp. P9(2023)]